MVTENVKTEGEKMWDFAANPAEETAALYVLFRELRADLDELRNRTYTGPMRHFVPPACEGIAPGGGCSAAHSRFGYIHVADEREGYCDRCGKPASEHECPEVISDRYDSQHPESEHDGGLGSGDWLKKEDQR